MLLFLPAIGPFKLDVNVAVFLFAITELVDIGGGATTEIVLIGNEPTGCSCKKDETTGCPV